MIRHQLVLLLVGAFFFLPARADDEPKKGDESSTEPGKPEVKKRPINRFFRGKIKELDRKKKRIVLYYDFEDPAQLQDFEEARPPRLLDAVDNQVVIRGGRLVMEGSSSIRHKIEGTAEYRAHFYARLSYKSNVGTVFTEPVLSEHYILFNLFDDRLYRDGGMFLCGVGMHLDQGAEDPTGEYVNWRDIFKSNLKNKVKRGQDVEVEVVKNGWDEWCRVGDTQGGGSSKGKVRKMSSYQFGLWVHNSRATFDDLTLTLEVTDKFLELNDLLFELSVDVEEVPETGLLAGVAGVPPGVRRGIERYAAEGGEPEAVIGAMSNAALPKKAREVACRALCDRKDPRAVPQVINALYAEDKETRVYGIRVVKAIVGKTFGYKPGGSEKSRSKAVTALHKHLTANRETYYG